ncbi:hypothetical protein DMW05_23945, partial [Vibrio parahaemolyticus]|nr:hypothetical protein [Vibrio parahaemolyticus]
NNVRFLNQDHQTLATVFLATGLLVNVTLEPTSINQLFQNKLTKSLGFLVSLVVIATNQREYNK